MICAFFPTDSGTICVIGLDADDTTLMMARKAEPETINFQDAVQIGIAIPTYVQIIYVKDGAEFRERIRLWLASVGVDATDKMIPFDQMSQPFGDIS